MPDESKPMPSSQVQQYEPAKITFETIEQHDGYVTGIAKYSNPAGLGQFSLRVSGRLEAIQEYADKARIVLLQVVPLSQSDRAFREKRHADAVAFYWKEWDARLQRLREIIDKADVELLADPERLWRLAIDAERAAQGYRTITDWAKDRVIEIEPTSDLDAGTGYLLSFTIDPPVFPGFRDVYAVHVDSGGVSSLYLSLQRTGNPAMSRYEEQGEPRAAVTPADSQVATYQLLGDRSFLRTEHVPL